MPDIPLYLVDAFADRPFSGNSAAVCLLETPAADRWLQSVAAEMQQSETAFVFPEAGQLRIRWLTPLVEVDLCGHATLAAAHVLQELSQLGQLPEFLQPLVSGGLLRFVSRSGVLTAESAGRGITLDFPASPVAPVCPPEGLLEALGLVADRLVYCGRTPFDYLLQLRTARDVRQLAPAMQSLALIQTRGVVVTAPGDAADHDFVSRFFAPASGVPEDPVTGSAHCALAVHWAPEFGRSRLFGYQASRRGGHVQMDLRGDRVRLTGQAVTVLRGLLTVPQP